MNTLRNIVLAEIQQWANTEDDFDNSIPPKVHPSGWEIWKVDNYYELFKDGDDDTDHYEYFPHSDIIEDRSDKVALMLGITMEEVKP